MPFLLAWLMPKKWLFIGGAFLLLIVSSAIAVGWLVIQRDRARAEAAEAGRDAAIYRTAAETSAATLHALQEDAARQAEIVNRKVEDANRRASHYADMAAAIAQAPVASNPPGCPVIPPRTGMALGGLRQPTTSGSN